MIACLGLSYKADVDDLRDIRRVLYGLHAILILADFPIGFRGKWMILDMVVPVFAYGLIAILIGHAYSRYALWHLKRLARQGLDDLPAPDEDDADAVKGA